MYETLEYNDHFQGFIITESDETRCIHIKELIYWNSFMLHTLSDGWKCFQIYLYINILKHLLH